MNDNTAKLLEQLAVKLGTTTEYLWGILLRQAPVDATITLIQVIFTMALGLALFKLNKAFSNRKNKVNYEDHAEILAPAMVISALLFTIFAISSFFCSGDIINGYFNPEFWALDRVLNYAKD